MELRKILYKTLHCSKLSVEEIADRVGCSASLLYRCANINDQGARFPLEKLLPLMLATKDFSILQHFAVRAGFILYRLPSRIKPKRVADLNEFQSIFVDVFRGLIDFRDGKAKKTECLSRLDQLLSQTIALRKGIESQEQMSFLGDE